MKYLLSIDAGTGSIRAIIFDKLGNQISMEQKEWTHLSEYDVHSSMNFDFVNNFNLLIFCIKEAIKKANINSTDILALSSSSMREGIVLYDKNDKELWAVANVDSRAGKEVKYLKDNFKNFEKKAYQSSGQTFALGAIPRLLWLKNNKFDLYKKVKKISMLSDWILFKLSGIIASDPSNAGTSGIFNLQKRNWDKQMLSKVGLNKNICPICVETGTIIGNVTKEASFLTNLSTKTKVVMGGGDVQLGTLGLGIVKESQLAVLGGSFWQQIVNIKKDTINPKNMKIRINPHVISDLSQAEGITFFSGLVLRWFVNNFCALEKEEAKQKNISVYELLDEKAKHIPIGSNGIIPIFSDSMKYDKWYHASPSFLNLSLDENIDNKISMYRCLLENACIVSAINLEKIQKFTNITIDEIVFAGGASKSSLWAQILCDVTGCKIKIPKITEATSLGAMISAGVGAGIYTSLQEASSKLIVWDKKYYPNEKNTLLYKSIKTKWKKIYKSQLKLVDKNLTKSMWKAAGL